MLGSFAMLVVLASPPASSQLEPSAHLKRLAKTCERQRGAAAKTFLGHLRKPKRDHVGWSVVVHGADAKRRAKLAKTIAKAAGAELKRVDPKRLAGRSVAEAGKNLDKLLANARNKDWILFFDEADAIFGKRTHVSDAHDRYANIEVSYLLERVSNHNDLILLGTQKPPEGGGRADALRDVVVAAPSATTEPERDRVTIPWAQLCRPPR